MFEHKVDIPAHRDTPAETVVLVFDDFNCLPTGLMLGYGYDNPQTQTIDMLKWGLDDDGFTALMQRVPHTEFKPILDAWAESGGMDEGELEASAPSSDDTGRRSKRTSSKTDSD